MATPTESVPETASLGRSRASGRTKHTSRLIALLFYLLAFVSAVAVYNFRLVQASVVIASPYQGTRLLRAYERAFGHSYEIKDLSIPGTLAPVNIRIYSPVGAKDPPPMVLVHGLVALGNRHEYLNQVAAHLVRMGFLVVLPNLPAETKFEMRTSDLNAISDTIHWIALDTHQQVTLVGNSFSAGLIIPAAASPTVKGEVKLIFCNSGYYNLDTIGHYFIRDPVFDPYGKPYRGDPPTPLEIAVPYLDELVPAQDVPNVRFAIATFNENDDADLPPNNPAMLRLSPRQRQEFLSLKSANTADTRNAYRGILRRHRTDIAALSPSSVLKGLGIPMYILHGEEDPIFPKGEVEWMRKDTAGNPEVHILTSPWIAHVKVGLPATLWQKYRVIDFCEAMLQKARQKKSLPE